MPRKNNKTKEKMDFGALKKIFGYCKPYLPAIIISVICAIIASITTIIGPEKISDLMNTITTSVFSGVDINISKIIEICVFLICLYLIGAVFGYVQQFIMAIVTQRTSKKLRKDINQKINNLPLSYFDKTTKGDILSRVTNDVDTISHTLGSSIANLVSAIVLFVGVTFKMFDTNWILALVTIATSLIGFVAMGIILGKSQKFFNKRQQYLGDINGHIEEVYTNYNIVKSYNGTTGEKAKFKYNNNNMYNVEWKANFLSGMMMPIMHFVGNLSYVLIFAVGVSIIVGGGTGVTIGTLIAFIIYARLFTQPLSTFAQSMQSLQQASASSKRVFEMLESEELSDESDKTLVLKDVKGNIEFKNVKFGYSDDKTIIKDFSAKIKAGQKVAIVGPTGAGKTTIVNLLMRFYEVGEGDILIDDVSIKDIKRQNVHDLFDMILQDTWLFGGTIKDNLVYNKQDVSVKTLDKVCEAVGLKHFISTLDNGYDTILTDSTSLSEGQKQQLTIARAMIKNSPLLILDEATSNVDTRTELVIQNAMDKLTKGRTSFIIAHRLSTIKNADMILVLKDGDIIEQGTHTELLSQNGVYAELYNSQFDEEDI
ncbi:MAG: ABC transporter ATP-binding protein [Clostridia bacterium]